MRPDFSANSRRPGANLEPDKNAWLDHAACTTSLDLYEAAAIELDSKGGSARRAKPNVDAAIAMCNGCPVINECLNAALTNEANQGRWSIQGGLTPAQRTLEMRRRNQPITETAICPKCATVKSLADFRLWPKRRACTDCLRQQYRDQERKRATKTAA